MNERLWQREACELKGSQSLVSLLASAQLVTFMLNRKITQMSDSPWLKRLVCLWLMLAISGCGKTVAPSSENPDGSTAETGTAEDAADPAGPKKKIIPIRHDLKSMDGNWAIVVTMPQSDSVIRDYFRWIIRLTKDADGKFQTEMIDTFTNDPEAKIESTEVEGKRLHVRLRDKSASIIFQGEFDGHVIRGTLAIGPEEIYLARCLPTDASKLADYVAFALPPAADKFTSAIKSMQNKPNPELLLQLARENPNSPVSMGYVEQLLGMHAKTGFDDETLRAIVDQYIDLSKVWGPPVHSQAEWFSAQQLVTTSRLPAEALKHLDQVEKLLGERGTSMKPQIQMLREEAETQLSLAKSRSKSDEDRAAAYIELQALLKKQPYNAPILLALAEYSAATRQRPAAIGFYADIVAIPMLEQYLLSRRAGQPAGDPTPAQVLTDLWTKEHGNADALPSHLKKLHYERMDSLRSEIVQQGMAAQPADAGDHTVLVEFFTGGLVPYAVASEVAVDALRATYPTSQVVTLRYHHHPPPPGRPGPDGLVNQDSEDRFAYYQMAQTPGLAIDGAALDTKMASLEGFVHKSPATYAMLRGLVDPRLKKSTPIRIELVGAIENGEFAIQAAVTGATEEELPSLRLRLALAEESVEAPMPNGMLSHAMIVREMPGGAKGITPKKGELKFSFSMPASELQEHLNEYITRYEAGSRIAIPAAMKPPIHGKLYLVGWVQNDKPDTEHREIGRAVLQTAIIPVTGSLPAAETPQPDPKPSTESTAKPASDTPPAPALPE